MAFVNQDISRKNLNDRAEKLNEIREEVAKCTKCKLSKSRTKTVPGEGNPYAEIVFVGEGPGANEDIEGIPFCGASGKFLDQMLNSINMDRADVFIANTVKCRPPGNRDPEQDEKEACRPFLERQFDLINPKLIICLGKHSTETFLPGAGSITKLHGRVLRRPNGKVYLPLYHPAAALHNGSLRETLIADFNKIPEILKKIKKLHKTIISNNEKNISQQKLI